MAQQRFDGRTAIVTGGASGLGRAIARRIAAEGGRTLLWDVNATALEEAVRETGSAGSAVVDVADYGAVLGARDAAVAALGKVDILVTSAGVIGPTAPIETYPLDQWRRVFAINVDGTFHCCRALIPHMRGHGHGRIVTIASVAGKEGNPGASAYSASKAAVIGFTKSLGKELIGTGILANAIAPAAIDTGMLGAIPTDQLDYMKSKIPMGRLGTAEECAGLVAYLASEECSFSTGAIFDISGGRATY